MKYSFEALERLGTIIQYRRFKSVHTVCSFELDGQQDILEEFCDEFDCVRNNAYDICSSEFLDAMSVIANEANCDDYCGRQYEHIEFRVIIDALGYKSDWKEVS